MQEEMKELLQKVNRLCAYESVLFFRAGTNDFFMLSYRIAMHFFVNTKQHSVYYDTSSENARHWIPSKRFGRENMKSWFA